MCIRDRFWSSVPANSWPTDEESIGNIRDQWEEPFGDKRQELVFIGQSLDKEAMLEDLNKCLLSEDELLKGESYWETLDDPFPLWK